MDTLTLLATILPVSIVSGLNLYITVLTIGIFTKMGWIDYIPGELQILSSSPLLLISGMLFLLQFFADKIQFVDNIWDSIHTLIRPIGAALIAFAILTNSNPIILIIGVLLAGFVSMISHSSKATMRMLINVISPFESFSNKTISIIEDILIIAFTYFALTYPLIAGTLAFCLIVLILIFTPRIIRWSFFLFKAIFYRFKGVINKISENEALPQTHLNLIEDKRPEIIVSARGQNIKGAHGRDGFVILTEATLYFIYNKWFKPRMWHVNRSRIKHSYFKQQLLVDIIEIQYLGERDRLKKVRLIFLKDRSPLVEKLASKLSSIPANIR
ncbi:MAG: DUF4126 domain-containing protein [Deltaproteobacteria bacterium]|nr:DUF4126 domain-containing protein [Deltaproteobacteria bacterium]